MSSSSLTPNIRPDKFPHGRETYAVYYGTDFINKRPLREMGDAARAEWLAKQHRTKEVIDAIHDRSLKNPVYKIPRMIHINDDEYNILEERAHGLPLSADLYKSLSNRQKSEIVTSIASFLVDMNELKPVGPIVSHKIADDIKFARLDKFIDTKMERWFSLTDVRRMATIRDNIGVFEYDTRMAWSHCDLNPGNVLYDVRNNKLSFIDFAEAGYQGVFRDIFAPLQIELGIYKEVYDLYRQYHDSSLYPMPNIKNPKLREIMKYRILTIGLKRFIKAADDLRANPTSEKGIKNNAEKVKFMQQQIENMVWLDHKLSK